MVKFWGNVDVQEDKSLCWNWRGSKNRGGYGIVNIKRSVFSTHRVSYFLTNGEDPSELQVLHHCDNPSCVNPNHLFLGTTYDNMIDRELKGRANHPYGMKAGVHTMPHTRAFGSRNGHFTHPEATLKGQNKPNSKLQDKDIIDIINLCAIEGNSLTNVANDYGVTVATISSILKRKTWKHIVVNVDIVVDKGKGDGSVLSKLKTEDVIKIRSLYSSGEESYGSLSKKFGVSKTQVFCIIKRKSWRHVA